MRRGRRGFTLVEALVIIVMIGILTKIIVPRFRVSNATQVRNAARLMASDLEAARTRALSTVTTVRVVFTTGTQTYTGYLDDNRDCAFAPDRRGDECAGRLQVPHVHRRRPVRPRHGADRAGYGRRRSR